MFEKPDKNLDQYFKRAEHWALDRERAERSSRRVAWIAVAVLATVAVAEAVAIVVMLPLKTVVPYTLMVDRQTGYIQALKPLDRDVVAPDRALTRSFISQYVIAREGFDQGSFREDYRKVSLWSTGEARDRYVASMQPTNPASPLAALPRGAGIDVEIRGISSLSNDTALVRFATYRSDAYGQARPQMWQAVLTYKFSNAAMSAGDRLTNPLGFQVIRYRRNAELPPEPPAANPAPVAAPEATATATAGRPSAGSVPPGAAGTGQ